MRPNIIVKVVQNGKVSKKMVSHPKRTLKISEGLGGKLNKAAALLSIKSS